MRTRTVSLTAAIAVLVGLALLAGSAAARAPAQPLQQGGAPTIISYQGMLTVDGAAYTGTGCFKFAVVNADGSATYWSNDGNSPPEDAVELTVSDGRFAVLLGDTALQHMTALPASAFSGTERYLRTWFSSDGATFTLLSPDRRIAAVPYALQAAEAKSAGDADALDGLDSAGFWQVDGNDDLPPSSSYLGTNDWQALELRVNGVRALRIEPAEVANLVGGSPANTAEAPGAGMLLQGAAVAGGGTGDHPNRVTDYHGAVGGGAGNTAGNANAGVNDADCATVAGGFKNIAGAYVAAVGGGEENSATGSGAVVGGGSFNSAGGNRATVPGGALNRANGSWSFAAGFRAKADHDGAFVWADSTDADFASTADDQFLVRATGGVGFTTGSAPFQVNGSDVQLRVGGACAVGSTVRAINADGTVVCEAHDARPIFAINTPDSAGNVGDTTSIAIGVDGLPLISHYDAGNQDLRVTHCSDAVCSSATSTTLDSIGDVGFYTSVAIGADGLGLIAYTDHDAALKVAHCNDVACTGATITTLETGLIRNGVSLTIGADGLGLISYHKSSALGLLMAAHCSDVHCTTSARTVLDNAGIVGENSSITIGTDGLGLISYFDNSNGDLKVAHCSDIICGGATVATVDNTGAGGGTSITIGSDGLGLISHTDNVNGNIKVSHCNDLACTTATTTVIDAVAGASTAITIGTDGLGLVVYRETSQGDLKAAHCSNVACTGATPLILDSSGDTGVTPSVTIGTDGFALISYYNASGGDLQLLHCSNVFCTPHFRRR